MPSYGGAIAAQMKAQAFGPFADDRAVASLFDSGKRELLGQQLGINWPLRAGRASDDNGQQESERSGTHARVAMRGPQRLIAVRSLLGSDFGDSGLRPDLHEVAPVAPKGAYRNFGHEMIAGLRYGAGSSHLNHRMGVGVIALDS